MKYKLTQILILMLIGIMVISLILMVSKKISYLSFWLIMAIGAIIAYFLRKRRSS